CIWQSVLRSARWPGPTPAGKVRTPPCPVRAAPALQRSTERAAWPASPRHETLPSGLRWPSSVLRPQHLAGLDVDEHILLAAAAGHDLDDVDVLALLLLDDHG